MSDRIILADTSIWVDYLRNGQSKEAQALDEFLLLGVLAICDPVKVEIVSGAATKMEFQRLRSLLDSVLLLEAPVDIWRQIEEYRFLAARKGIKAGIVDLWIAAVAKENNALIWTTDKDFLHLIKIIHFEIFHL